MIEEIHIRDLGVIREARLAFKPGLNVITGETGAGKTMVLTALGLLLGQRADAGSVRSGQQQTLVQGRIAVVNADIRERIEDLGGQLEDGEVLMNRSVSVEGKSRAAVGGASVPVAALGEIGNQLVVVHGQADQLRLKSAAAQRDALDSFAGAQELLRNYQEEFRSWQQTIKLLDQLKSDSSSRASRIEELNSAITEISKVSPRIDEDIELADMANRLSNLESLRSAATAAHEMLSSENDSTDVSSLLGQARKLLEHEQDSKLNSLADRLSDLSMQSREISGELASYLASLDTDSELSLDQVQLRRAEVNTLLRKYGSTIEEVLQYQEQAASQLSELDNSDERIAELDAIAGKQLQNLTKLAEQLSATRKSAALQLAAQVTEELRGLAMSDAKLVVEVNPADELTLHGSDHVSLLLSSYTGAEPRPIGKGASGGELSRIMLALEVVLAKEHQATTFIFDEVDAGVGGAAAIEVGRRLARLASQAQVIVVTHLAQVAAFADHQLRVLKNSAENITETDVVQLDQDARLEELARMLSGLSESSSAREHAAELMSLANQRSAN